MESVNYALQIISSLIQVKKEFNVLLNALLIPLLIQRMQDAFNVIQIVIIALKI